MDEKLSKILAWCPSYAKVFAGVANKLNVLIGHYSFRQLMQLDDVIKEHDSYSGRIRRLGARDEVILENQSTTIRIESCLF